MTAWVLKECSQGRFWFPFIIHKALQNPHTYKLSAYHTLLLMSVKLLSLFSILPCSVLDAAAERFLETLSLHAHTHAVCCSDGWKWCDTQRERSHMLVDSDGEAMLLGWPWLLPQPAHAGFKRILLILHTRVYTFCSPITTQRGRG